MQIEFVIHGVPQGHQVWGTQADKYYESFYGKYEIYGKPKQVFVVEVRDNPETRSSYYSLIRPQNVLAASGRPGSYFGMSVRVDGHYCTDVYSLFQLLELAYNQYCANKLIKSNGESEQFAVEAFDPRDPNLAEAKRYVLNQIQSHLGAEFESLDASFTKKNASTVEYYNLDDVNSEAFFNATRIDGRVIISRDYPTKDAVIKSLRTKDKQHQEVKKNDDDRIDELTKENAELKRIKESYLSLKSEYAKVQEQAQGLSASLATEKDNVSTLRQQVSSLSGQVEQLKNAANIQQIASTLEKSMGEMLPFLKTIAPSSKPVQVEQPIEIEEEPRTRVRNASSKNSRTYKIAIIILIALLIGGVFFAFRGLRSGPRISALEKEKKELSAKCDFLQGQVEQLQHSANESQSSTPSFESVFSVIMPDATIDVKNFSGSEMTMGKEYIVSIKGYSGPGEWQADGFLMKGSSNDKSVKITPSKQGMLTIAYKVNGSIVKTRPFYVN